MTIEQWQQNALARLDAAGISSSHLEVLVLLEDHLGKDRALLLAHPEIKLTSLHIKALDTAISRRIKHEPLAYIRGKTEFYGREFKVNSHTLEPRPETETIVELLMQLMSNEQRATSRKVVIIDVGTGSGCLAITAKLEFPEFQVVAVDIDSECLKVARRNAKNLGADITFFNGDLLQPIPYTIYHIPYTVLANLPYVPDSHTINQAAMFEPKHAIFGGPDGLDLYRRLFDQIKELKDPPQYVLTESLPFQHRSLELIAKKSNYRLKLTHDFIQLYTAEV